MENDPRLNKMKDSKQNIINEAGYYLLYRDNGVRQDIKKIAKEHYNAICNSSDNQFRLEKESRDGVFKFKYYPSREGGAFFVLFSFDSDGHLKIASNYIDRTKKAVQDMFWGMMFK